MKEATRVPGEKIYKNLLRTWNLTSRTPQGQTPGPYFFFLFFLHPTLFYYYFSHYIQDVSFNNARTSQGGSLSRAEMQMPWRSYYCCREFSWGRTRSPWSAAGKAETVDLWFSRPKGQGCSVRIYLLRLRERPELKFSTNACKQNAFRQISQKSKSLMDRKNFPLFAFPGTKEFWVSRTFVTVAKEDFGTSGRCSTTPQAG